MFDCQRVFSAVHRSTHQWIEVLDHPRVVDSIIGHTATLASAEMVQGALERSGRHAAEELALPGARRHAVDGSI